MSAGGQNPRPSGRGAFNDYKFGEEVEYDRLNQDLWEKASYCGVGNTSRVFYILDWIEQKIYSVDDEQRLRRPRKMVTRRFQPMVSIPDGRVEMIKVGEEDEWNGWRAVGNIIEIEVDVNEASKE